MNQYYILSNKNKKPSFIKRLFKQKGVKPVVKSIPKQKINSVEFYKKYGIIYTGNLEGSCISSLF